MNYPPSIDPEKEVASIIAFISKTISAADYTQAVIAASGGIDSATSLTLTANALGPENVHALLLPSRQTASQHRTDAKAAAQVAGVPSENIHTIPITAILQKTWRVINHHTENKDTPNSLNQLRLANLAARSRMLVLYDFAKKNHCLVIGTENHSEYHLGYFTRFGDEASDIEPIQHLYKTQVYELAQYLKVPETILTKAPTAGLWAGQTDESELGFSYEVADPILYLHFDKDLDEPAIAKELNIEENTVAKVLFLCHQNNFKHQVPYSL